MCQVRQVELHNLKELNKMEELTSEATAEYAQITRENTLRLERLADLTAEQHTLEMSLNSTQGQLAGSESGGVGRAGMDEVRARSQTNTPPLLLCLLGAIHSFLSWCLVG